MHKSEVLRVLTRVEMIIGASHVVYTSGKHGAVYVNKDALYPHTAETSYLCREIARRFRDDDINVVIAPAIGGAILSQWTAHHLTQMRGHKVFSVYAEKHKSTDVFVIKRGYDQLVVGKNILVVDDVLTTGGSARKVIEAVHAISGNVVGLGVLCNRGGITPHEVADVPLIALTDITLKAWDEADCPLCMLDVPVNTDVGHGRTFLERKSMNS